MTSAIAQLHRNKFQCNYCEVLRAKDQKTNQNIADLFVQVPEFWRNNLKVLQTERAIIFTHFADAHHLKHIRPISLHMLFKQRF